MSLRTTLAKVVGSAFTALGDIVISATYRRTSSTYNPATGSNTVTNTDYTVPMVLTSYSSFEVDKNVVLVSDRKCIVRQAAMSVSPNIATDKVIAESKTYNIIRVTQDPAAATYTLQLRSPA